MSGSLRQWIRDERNRKVREILEARGYVLDYWLVYRIDFGARLSATLVPAESRATFLRTAARGSSRRLHEERMARRLA